MTLSCDLFPSTGGRRRLPRGAALALAGGLALAGLAALAAPASAQDADPVVARVNGAEIRASDLAIAEEDMGSALQQLPPEAKRDYVVNFLADIIVVAQAAEAQKLAETADFKRRLALARNRLLMERMLQAQGQTALTDEAMRKTYEEAARQMSADKEVHARHILLDTEEEAKAIAEELKKGGDFAELAKRSKEQGAGERAGDLGYFTKEQMVPAFSEAAFALEPGKISEPVKTEFGWHVIKVEDIRARQAPPFDQVRKQIEEYLTRKTQAEVVGKLRQQARIERLDKPAEKK